MNTDKNLLPVQAADLMKEKKIHPSYHRLRILEYLMKNKTHPTVEMIYKDLIKEIPTLSKTTIYNTLKMLSGNNLVQELTIEENELRFDFDTSQHAHFKCIKCHKIYDIMQKFSIYEKTFVEDHKVEEQHIYFRGMCKLCLDKAAQQTKKTN